MSAPSTAAPATRLEPDGPRPPRRRSTALKSLWRTLAPPATTIVTVVVLWQLVVSLLQVATYLVPGPMDVFRDLWDNRELFAIHTKVTGVEVLTGFGLAVVVGFSLGILMVISKFADRAMYPLLVTMQAVPKIAIAPILVIWFGFGLTPKTLTAFLVAVFPIVVNTAMGFKQTPIEMIHLARSMGASAWTTFMTFRLPTALPSIFTGLKVAAALAVVGAVSGEFVAANEGLGYIILTASGTLDSARVFGGVILLAAQGIVLYGAVEILEWLCSPMSRRTRRLETSMATA